MTDREILLSLPHKKRRKIFFLKYGKFKTCKRNTFSDLVELNYGIYKGVPINCTRIRWLTSGFSHVYAVFLSSKHPWVDFCCMKEHTLPRRVKEGKGLGQAVRGGQREEFWAFSKWKKPSEVLLRSCGGRPGSWIEPWPSPELWKGKPKQPIPWWMWVGRGRFGSWRGGDQGHWEYWKVLAFSWEACTEGRVELRPQGLEGLRKEALGAIVGSSYPDISAFYSCLPAEIVHCFFPPRTAIISSLSPVLWFSFQI